MEQHMQQDQGHKLGSSESNLDYSFAYSDPTFSDRVLKLVIFDDTLPEDTLPEENDDWENDDGSTVDVEWYELIRSLKQRKDPVLESSKESKIKTLNVSSVVLAAKSSFFHQLFTDAMKQCNHHEVTLHIYSSEEAALMEVIKFMYSSSLLSADKPNALVEVLVAADKFNVPSCIKHCCHLLLSSYPMTAKLALLYIDLSSVLFADEIQPLLNAAKDFIPKISISSYRQEIIRLSCEGIRILLSHNYLKVDSEDEAFELLKDWSKYNYPDHEEHWRVIKNEMLKLIRLQHLTPLKVKEVLCELCERNHLDTPVLASMMDALVLDGSKHSLPKHGRSYSLLPVAVMTFDIPFKQCIVFMELKKEKCMQITDRFRSQTFKLDEHVFSLTVARSKDDTKGYTFSSFLWLERTSKDQIEVEYEFSVRQTSLKFLSLFERTRVFKSGEDAGYGLRDLFNATWDSVMAEDSKYFINGTLHLRVIVTLLSQDNKMVCINT